MKRTLKRKITSAVTMGVLGTMLTASAVMAGTVQSREVQPGFFLEVESYYERDWDVTHCERKYTDSSIAILCDTTNYPMIISAIGSHQWELTYTDFADCSDGHTYYMDTGDAERLTNYVNEWGYEYGGVMGRSTVDALTKFNGFFRMDI